LINRRLYLPRLLLTLSSFEKDYHQRILTGHYISMSGLAVIHQSTSLDGFRSVSGCAHT
jgi:hypothetical protein